MLKSFTLDVWTGDMYALMAIHSPWVILYFAFIVVLGGFFLVNLFLAVLFQVFPPSCLYVKPRLFYRLLPSLPLASYIPYPILPSTTPSE